MAALKSSTENRADTYENRLPRPQRNAVILLTALAVFVVVFWVWQMNAHINGPFNYKLAKTDSGTNAEEEFNKVLQGADTDRDGVSDYEEIYTFKTSPYLEDTDSDGLSDRQEIDNGTNPLCPKGKDCSVAIDLQPVATSSTSVTNSSTSSTNPSGSLDSTSADEAALTSALSGVSDAATLRQLLISSGASKTDLDKISDADLMKSYQETLDSQNKQE